MSYLRVRREYSTETVIRKSRFITTLVPISDWDDALVHLQRIRKTYSDATHNCYAAICDTCGNVQRFSDDGEPQGTAGMPMLDVLRKRNIRMTLAVVTRYFGGIKLGAGGLVSAYTAGVADALDQAELDEYLPSVRIEVVCSYSDASIVTDRMLACGAEPMPPVYDTQVSITAHVPTPQANRLCDALRDATNGRASVSVAEEGEYPFAVRTE